MTARTLGGLSTQSNIKTGSTLLSLSSRNRSNAPTSVQSLQDEFDEADHEMLLDDEAMPDYHVYSFSALFRMK
jgi:hypothetical protein